MLHHADNLDEDRRLHHGRGALGGGAMNRGQTRAPVPPSTVGFESGRGRPAGHTAGERSAWALTA